MPLSAIGSPDVPSPSESYLNVKSPCLAPATRVSESTSPARIELRSVARGNNPVMDPLEKTFAGTPLAVTFSFSLNPSASAAFRTGKLIVANDSPSLTGFNCNTAGADPRAIR